MIKLFNTLSGKKEEFSPIQDGMVKMYHCGPTVYDYAHIGNLRVYVFADILRRTLEYSNFKVEQVINITDIGHLVSDADDGDDKMTKGLKREGLPFTLQGLKTLADKYEIAFKEDLKKLNIETPDHFPRATSYIKEDIEIIKKLEEKGFAYSISDGIYFDTAKFSDYGKLGGLTPIDESMERVKSSGKKNPRDFALWKLSGDGHLGFESPWGKGFPGWHIECSAMSAKLLGQPFDIHTGGADHIPVHHNNEIAQSEAAYGKPLAHFWLHNAFLNIEGNKMAKSAGNFNTLNDLEKKGFSPLSYRYLLLSAHYRSQINFTLEALEGSQNALKNLVESFLNLGSSGGSIIAKYQNEFTEYMSDDLNTPKGLALVWEIMKDESPTPADKRATIIDFDKVLGLDILEQSMKLQKALENIPPSVKNLAEERELARKSGDFKRADNLRAEIQSLGFRVEDGENGPKILPR